LVADNTFSRVEGEFTVLTRLFPPRGHVGNQFTKLMPARGHVGEHHNEDGDHHGRRLDHFWTNFKWENPNCDLVISIGDCHLNNGGQDFSALLTDVVDRWNNVPQNQDLTGATFTPNGISFQKTTCSDDYQVACDNPDMLNRISSCNGDYGDNGWAGLATIWTYSGTNFLAKGLSKVNEYYNMNNAETQHVLCQEIGHSFPMGHQDESGADFNTCMDYSVWTSPNRYPNLHDVELLDAIYDVCPNRTPSSAPVAPSMSPSARPTPVPTSHMPTVIPSKAPTPFPTRGPTKSPSARPTPVPTHMPTVIPSKAPTPFPTRGPTALNDIGTSTTISHLDYENYEDLNWFWQPCVGTLNYLVHFELSQIEDYYDYLQFGPAGSNAISFRCTGTAGTCPDFYISSDSGIRFDFHSDYSITEAGFTLSVNVVGDIPVTSQKSKTTGQPSSKPTYHDSTTVTLPVRPSLV
jgi:hypothetical protein